MVTHAGFGTAQRLVLERSVCKTSDPDCTLPLGATENISCYIEECNAEDHSILVHLYDEFFLPIISELQGNSCSKNYSFVAHEELNNRTFRCGAYDGNITTFSNETVIWVQGMTSIYTQPIVM